MRGFDETFSAAADEGRGVLFPYMMCGMFDDASTVSVFRAMADAGADGFEVGIPYADPLMDGPVIQEAGARALAAGMTLDRGIGLAGEIRIATGVPCAVMTYVNPVLTMGLDVFAGRVAESGSGAVIIADLPVDESEPFREALAANGVGLVQFAAPTTTDARLDRVATLADPFVYGVAELGVTGERSEASSRSAGLAVRVRARSSVPLVFGVGISTPEAAAAACEHGDGVIVGSALVRRALGAESADAAAQTVGEAVEALARGVRASV
jgi:tryptophan synthase alpha chain